jgi:hypothetical protein
MITHRYGAWVLGRQDLMPGDGTRANVNEPSLPAALVTRAADAAVRLLVTGAADAAVRPKDAARPPATAVAAVQTRARRPRRLMVCMKVSPNGGATAARPALIPPRLMPAGWSRAGVRSAKFAGFTISETFCAPERGAH